MELSNQRGVDSESDLTSRLSGMTFFSSTVPYRSERTYPNTSLKIICPNLLLCRWFYKNNCRDSSSKIYNLLPNLSEREYNLRNYRHFPIFTPRTNRFRNSCLPSLKDNGTLANVDFQLSLCSCSTETHSFNCIHF